MAARESAEVRAALAHKLSTGCSWSEAAAKFGVHPRSIQRAAARANVPPGRPGWRKGRLRKLPESAP